MHILYSLILSSHTSGFNETLTNSQTGPVCMSSTCCVSVVQIWLSVKLGDFQEQAITLTRADKTEHVSFPWHTHCAPGQHLWWSVLLRAKTVQTLARIQGNIVCIVVRYALHSIHTVIVICKCFCQQCFSHRATKRDSVKSDDRCCGWDQQGVRMSRSKTISHPLRLYFLRCRLTKIGSWRILKERENDTDEPKILFWITSMTN